jgi:fatty-acyl-CoA synthase
LWGEVGIAACVLREGAQVDGDQIIVWLKREIAGYKIPKRVMLLHALPKSGYGKVDKQALGSIYVAQVAT